MVDDLQLEKDSQINKLFLQGFTLSLKKWQLSIQYYLFAFLLHPIHVIACDNPLK